jgi:hypothetical protein
MKIKIIAFLLFSSIAFSQKFGVVSGGFESNSQWYLNDKGLKDEFNNPTTHPDQPLRSNSYLFLNYKYKKWSAGIQGESYEDNALLNMNPKYQGINVGTYFVQYKSNMIDVTGGYFYEQFGSGLLFRSWEDRALGINNALRGGRIVYKPTTYLTMKALCGNQRTGFDVTKSTIFGFDAEVTLSEILKYKETELSLGFSYLGRDEKTAIENPKFASLTNGYSGRLNLNNQSFYVSTEFDYKSKDAVVQVTDQIDNNLIKPGSALLLNSGYSKKRFGINGTFRRIENMSFFSERAAKGNSYNDRIMNFIPSLTKQQHYNLANIYVYQAQPNVILADKDLVKAGEIGGQIDVFYEVKKGTKFGGKNGMKIAANFSNWNALSGTFYLYNPQDYKTDFFGFGKRYFTDFNVEITKKWNAKWQSIFSYVNQYYNKKMIQETTGEVKSNILTAETTYRFASTRSIRVVGEHLWADHDKKNWAAATIEFNINSKISFYSTDLYNYGNDTDYLRNHYYSFGGSYRVKATRVALNYGRQRGGLVCVGGVCRYVPESSGLSMTISTSF